MLVLTRKSNEKIVLNEDGNHINGKIILKVLGIYGKQVRLGIDAPKEVVILREELTLPKEGYHHVIDELEKRE